MPGAIAHFRVYICHTLALNPGRRTLRKRQQPAAGSVSTSGFVSQTLAFRPFRVIFHTSDPCRNTLPKRTLKEGGDGLLLEAVQGEGKGSLQLLQAGGRAPPRNEALHLRR